MTPPWMIPELIVLMVLVFRTDSKIPVIIFGVCAGIIFGRLWRDEDKDHGEALNGAAVTVVTCDQCSWTETWEPVAVAARAALDWHKHDVHGASRPVVTRPAGWRWGTVQAERTAGSQ